MTSATAYELDPAQQTFCHSDLSSLRLVEGVEAAAEWGNAWQAWMMTIYKIYILYITCVGSDLHWVFAPVIGYQWNKVSQIQKRHWQTYLSSGSEVTWYGLFDVKTVYQSVTHEEYSSGRPNTKKWIPLFSIPIADVYIYYNYIYIGWFKKSAPTFKKLLFQHFSFYFVETL